MLWRSSSSLLTLAWGMLILSINYAKSMGSLNLNSTLIVLKLGVIVICADDGCTIILRAYWCATGLL